MKGGLVRVCFLVLILGSVSWPLRGLETFPSLETDRRAEEFARREHKPGGYGWEDLAEIALWASGADTGDRPEENPFYKKIEEALDGLLGSDRFPQDARGRGEFILDFIHAHYLKQYSVRQTGLDTLLNNGRYNCVSSALLYMILAQAVGLETLGVLTRDHAFISLRTGNEWVDVETTNPYGFDPGTRREFQDRFGRTTGFAYVPPGNYRERTGLSQLEMISLILSNRIVNLETQGRYGEAVPLALNRKALLSRRTTPVNSPFFSDPAKDALDRVFNFGASLIMAGKESEALQWADMAGGRFPDDTRWQDFILTAMNNRTVKFLRAGRIAEAREALNLNSHRLSADNYRRIEALVRDAELVRLTGQAGTSEEADAALDAVSRAEEQGLIPAERGRELRTAVLLKEGERIGKSGDWKGAMAYLEEGIARYGTNRPLENALSLFRSNRAGELHNRFADLYNNGEYREAERFVREALREFPGDRLLTADLGLAERALRGRQ